MLHFHQDKTSGVFPLTIDFVDRSTGNVTSWTWDFGDGNTSTNEQNPTHVFTDAGRYTISLTVDDGTNNSITTKNNLIWATAVQDTLYEEDLNLRLMAELILWEEILIHGVLIMKIMMLII